MAGDSPAIGSNSPTPAIPPHGVTSAKAAGAKATGAGQLGNTTTPQPAPTELKLTAPDLVKQAEDAKKQAEAALKELKAAAQDVSNLYSGIPTAAFSAAQERVNVALEKAENATAKNVYLNEKIVANLGVARDQVLHEIEGLRLRFGGAFDVELNMHVSLNDQRHSAEKASDDALALRGQVRDTIDQLPEECATKRYPNLKIADEAVQKALSEVNSFEDNPGPNEDNPGPRWTATRATLRAKVGASLVNARAAWSSASEHVHETGDKTLQRGCEAAIRRLEQPDFMMFIAASKYPNITTAENRYFSLRNDIFVHNSTQDNNLGASEALVVQAEKAALDINSAWVAARDDARKAGDTVLADFCGWQANRWKESFGDMIRVQNSIFELHQHSDK
jgi:hypothetical protein